MVFSIHFSMIMLLRIVIAHPKLNLYFTEWRSTVQNNTSFRHDCLYASVSIQQLNPSVQITSYCMSESTPISTVQNYHTNQQFTFAELYKEQITTKQLYFWSAPMDVLERYQLFLNQIPISLQTSMALQLFYNCTLPRFGSFCQYEYIYSKSNYLLLNAMIHDDYSFKRLYESNTVICYTGLECNRDPQSFCLQWSEICDGKIDCLKNGMDEDYCWKLEINECEENEYRCTNGQCIPFGFFRDDHLIPDCRDGSDEIVQNNYKRSYYRNVEQTFHWEDIVFRPDNATTPASLTTSCLAEQSFLLLKAQFLRTDNSIDETCSTTFKCLTNIIFEDDPEEKHKHTTKQICPNSSILFDHLAFVYVKNNSILIDKQCDGLLKSHFILFLSNLTCIRPEDNNNSCVYASLIPRDERFWKCNSIINNNSKVCHRPNMYQCINSSKCISIHRLRDGIRDCSFNDDENILMFNHTSLSSVFKNHFKCTKTNTYISYRLVKNGQCDCDLSNDDCEDEDFDISYIRHHISFQTICDGYTELLPIIINGENHTDETECQQWSCNNIYTHCDGIWNCFDGMDEINCNYSSVLKCPSNHHLCISFLTNQLICLSIRKVNDGSIDCLGATDEPKLCRSTGNNFYCIQNNIPSCIQHQQLCDGYNDCDRGDDEQICHQKFLHSRLNFEMRKQQIIYFSLDTRTSLETPITNSKENLLEEENHSENSCYRGLDIKVWLDNKSNLTKLICLCPPSYFGNQCQYQNKRISLTIQFQTLSYSWQIPFTILILLIDHTDQRIIHSYQQLVYLSIKHCQTKFHFDLIYSKNFSENSSIHIDIYEQFSFNYRGSFFYPILFPFLPIYRLSLQLTIPYSNHTIYNCLFNECIHGKCIRYRNFEEKTFCQCEKGWSGKFCSIPFDCQCSFDSLCIGIDASTNRSICLCPINKFGSQCLLTNFICKTSSCFNHGQCLSLLNEDYFCICPKGYSGKQCEIIDKNILITFDENILLSESVILHFIQIQNNSQPKRLTTFKTISAYQKLLSISWSDPFHLLFIELSNKRYYLTMTDKNSNSSIKTISLNHRCQHINELKLKFEMIQC